MKTIEIRTNGGIAEFSTKSLKLDGREYSYAKINDIKHSSAKKLYLFQYEGHWHKLEYDEADEKNVKTLFSKIAALKAQRDAATKLRSAKIAAALEEQPETPHVVVEPIPEAKPSKLAEVIAAVEAEDTPAVVPVVEEPAEPIMPAADLVAAVEAQPEEPVDVIVPVEEVPAVETPVTPVVPETPVVLEAPAAPVEAAAVVEEALAAVEPPVVPATEAPAEDVTQAGAVAFAAEEEFIADEEAAEVKSNKLKKSLMIFGAVIAVFVIAAVAYFFILGPSSNPNIGPNSDGTQQYNDIDELIEDLQ